MRSMDSDYFKRLEQFIDDYMDEYGRSPTTREIAAGTGRALSTVHKYLSQMRADGVLDYSGHRNITTRRKRITATENVRVPILGQVSCGLPRFAVENIEEYVQLPVALFGHGPFFLLRASGESMIEADINHGDLVLIRQQDYARTGDIVVALIGEEATLKRYYPELEHNRICLHPENRTMDDIYVSSCAIQGVAVKVLKDLIQQNPERRVVPYLRWLT